MSSLRTPVSNQYKPIQNQEKPRDSYGKQCKTYNNFRIYTNLHRTNKTPRDSLKENVIQITHTYRKPTHTYTEPITICKQHDPQGLQATYVFCSQRSGVLRKAREPVRIPTLYLRLGPALTSDHKESHRTCKLLCESLEILYS